MVLAERLTECGTQSVLLLEGGEEPTIIGNYKVPGAALDVLGIYTNATLMIQILRLLQDL